MSESSWLGLKALAVSYVLPSVYALTSDKL
jgi:hypothetical protein